eukprot:Phypoly_transcript_09369.p1 GENE.Phypoly_transcript_09369~~Phypoly_transcript_09369.p1  ORF type:complete len:445 (+),score=62.54 Phypoly_transcript_09369:61-1395(+)
MANKVIITDVHVKDIRFPTHLGQHGSDAMHTDPDYSCPYVTLPTNVEGLVGVGITFTLGRGNEIIVLAIKSLCKFVVGKTLDSLTSNLGGLYREITSEPQLRWLGPEKGAIHLAACAVLNAVWDLYAKHEKKPLWKLLVDMTPEQIVNAIDFRYIEDALTHEEAIAILSSDITSKEKRIAEIKEKGFPAYTTSVGWLGYSDEKIRTLCKEALAEGFDKFKMKVGANLEDDQRRAAIIREEIGWDRRLSMDANQRWGVHESISNMQVLAKFKPYWIEEPTSPDDILGHATIASALAPLGIKVATGEHCQNRIIFKQLLQAKSISICQIDSCRVGSVNENLAIILMAKKFGVPVCPHAGGVGLCEYVNHLIIWDYVSVAHTIEGRVCEYVDHLHEHFVYPCIVKNGKYTVPETPGYSGDMWPKSLEEYEYPTGQVWKELIAKEGQK